MVIINRLLCVSTGAIPKKLALLEIIDWLQTKGSLYSRQDLNRFSVETHPMQYLQILYRPIARYPKLTHLLVIIRMVLVHRSAVVALSQICCVMVKLQDSYTFSPNHLTDRTHICNVLCSPSSNNSRSNLISHH